MNRNRIFSVALAGAVLAACGSAAEGTATSKGPPETLPTAEPTTTTEEPEPTTTTEAPLPPLPDDPALAMHVAPDVTADQADIVRRGTVAARAEMGDATRMDVFVYVDPNVYVGEFADLMDKEPGTEHEIPDILASNSSAGSNPDGSHVFAFLNGATVFTDYPSHKTAFVTAVHEAVHGVQLSRQGGRISPSSDGVPGEGPTWLVEGHADFRAWNVTVGRREHSALRSYADVHERALVSFAVRAGVPLREMETYAGFQRLGVDEAYAKAALAAELLQTRAGKDALDRGYWEAVAAVGWREAFPAAFGMTLDEFYAEFEAWEAAGYSAP